MLAQREQVIEGAGLKREKKLQVNLMKELNEIGLNKQDWDAYASWLKGRGWTVVDTGDCQEPGVGTARYVARHPDGVEINVLGNGIVRRTPSGDCHLDAWRKARKAQKP